MMEYGAVKSKPVTGGPYRLSPHGLPCDYWGKVYFQINQSTYNKLHSEAKKQYRWSVSSQRYDWVGVSKSDAA